MVSEYRTTIGGEIENSEKNIEKTERERVILNNEEIEELKGISEMDSIKTHENPDLVDKISKEIGRADRNTLCIHGTEIEGQLFLYERDAENQVHRTLFTIDENNFIVFIKDQLYYSPKGANEEEKEADLAAVRDRIDEC